MLKSEYYVKSVFFSFICHPSLANPPLHSSSRLAAAAITTPYELLHCPTTVNGRKRDNGGALL